MYADTMPGEIAAWVQAEQTKCAAATEGPWEANEDSLRSGWLDSESGFIGGADWFDDCTFIASARTGYPVLLDYATGLLDAHRVADVMDDACGTESTRDIRDTLRSQIAALHAALVAQGIIGGKG